jgi:hypothetical protein
MQDLCKISARFLQNLCRMRIRLVVTIVQLDHILEVLNEKIIPIPLTVEGIGQFESEDFLSTCTTVSIRQRNQELNRPRKDAFSVVYFQVADDEEFTWYQVVFRR